MEAFFIVGIVQVVFSIILIGRNKELILADKILILFLAACGVELAYSLFNFVYATELPDFIVFPLLFGPLIYISVDLWPYIMSSNEMLCNPNSWMR